MAYGAFIVGGGGTIPRIGDAIVTTVKTSPATRYKNTTWELVAQNRVPMGAGDGHEGGETVEAGLPNITGEYTKRKVVNSANEVYNDTQRAQKAFKVITSDTKLNSIQLVTSSASNTGGENVVFDASLSDPIYGASDTVQPPAYYFYFWRRVS